MITFKKNLALSLFRRGHTLYYINQETHTEAEVESEEDLQQFGEKALFAKKNWVDTAYERFWSETYMRLDKPVMQDFYFGQLAGIFQEILHGNIVSCQDCHKVALKSSATSTIEFVINLYDRGWIHVEEQGYKVLCPHCSPKYASAVLPKAA